MKQSQIIKNLERELSNRGTSKKDIYKIKNNICLNCDYKNIDDKVICKNCNKLILERTIK